MVFKNGPWKPGFEFYYGLLFQSTTNLFDINIFNQHLSNNCIQNTGENQDIISIH